MVYGIGTNDLRGIHKVCWIENGIRHDCIIYKTWQSMLGRITKESSYSDTKISPDWLYFSNFKTWYEKQYIGTNYQLDKDLLSLGSNTYSPTTCLFIPCELNSAINFVRVKRGSLLLGVSRHRTTFRTSYISVEGTRHQKNFSSEIEAHHFYLQKKIEYIQSFKLKYPDFNIYIDNYCEYINSFILQNKVLV